MRIACSLPEQFEVLEAGLWIPLTDGTRLAARLWLPKVAYRRPVPALLEYLPYRKGDLTRVKDETYHAYFAGHGYASIRVDIRGSGDSFGVMHDEYESHEQDDALEVIAWLARQEWCSGSVGMFGISWSGFNALQVAARRPPALRAIITACSSDDRYRDDMHYCGGCLLNDNLDWGTAFLAYLSMPGNPDIMGPGWRDNWLSRLEAIEPPAARWMRHPIRDGYWRHGSIAEDYAAISCPVLAVGGWLDGYTNVIPRLLQNLKVPTRAIIGPAAHQFGFEDRPPGPAYGFLQEAVRWWDHWLKGKSTGVMDEPQLRAYMASDLPASTSYAVCPGRWVAEQEWPSARIYTRRLYLGERSLLTEPQRSAPILTHMSAQTVGLQGGEWCPYGTGGDGPEFPGDQRQDDAYSLTFDSEQLPNRTEILGVPVVELEVTSDKPYAFIAVRLNDVKPCGSVSRVSFGLLNLAHLQGDDRAVPLQPGRPYRVRIQLNDAAYSFGAAHRIRLSISTCYWPMVWPSPDPVTLQVLPASSHLDLPIRPYGNDEPRMNPLPEPEATQPAAVTPIEPAPLSAKVTHDLTTGTTEFRRQRGSGYFQIADNGITTGFNVTESMSIGSEPDSALAEVNVSARTQRAGSNITVEAQSRLTAVGSAFLLQTDLRVCEDAVVVLSREWTDRIPRT